MTNQRSVNKDIATQATSGDIFEHFKETNSDGSPLRCRVTGMCKVWKTMPERFKLPVKYGLYQSFYITEENASEWHVS